MNWKPNSVTEVELIHKIAKRAADLAKHIGIRYDLLLASMDITACHLNGNPLMLQELLDADNGNFAHDILGIRIHINRETGELEDFFVPRYSVR